LRVVHVHSHRFERISLSVVTGCAHAAVRCTVEQVHNRIIGDAGGGIGRVQEHSHLSAVTLVIPSTDDVARGLAGDVFHRQPGLKDTPELDQAEQEHEQKWQNQCELDEPLSPALVLFLVYF
jgi:hypothetical protein